MAIISIGLNPGWHSVTAGIYFANPRNRFWTACERADLFQGWNVGHAGLEPRVFQTLVAARVMGFTDVVKRPTRGANDLRAGDFRRWVPVLERKLTTLGAAIVWFHGRVAWRQFVRFSSMLETSSLRGAEVWGEQAVRIGASRVYVTPNPSSANAAFSLDALVGHYRGLRDVTGH
ncbi:MAG: mismatch-specific DNA-glycosylase [Gammaproteobacteria bacterium]|nr:mismatch-specific DNA-glycosylase [Gammaproteobacteria bacterium]